MASASRYLSELPAWTRELLSRTAEVERRIAQYVSTRRQAPNAAGRRAYDQRAADIIGAKVGRLREAADAVDRWIANYRSLRGQFGAQATNAARIKQEARQARTRAQNALLNWRRQPAFRYDTRNASWLTRVFGRLFDAGKDVAVFTGRAQSRAAAPYVRAAESVAGAIEAGGSAARRTFDKTGDGEVEGARPRGGLDEGADDWGIFMAGTAGVAVILLGGGLVLGLASKRKGKKNPSRCERRLRQHRRALRS